MIGNAAINDYIADVLVRYFRVAVAQEFASPTLRIRSSHSLLSEYWSISQPVKELVRYLQTHIHELQSVLQVEQQVHKDSIRGRIDARQTQLLRLQSGQPTWAICISPSRSFESGPNRVLAWVLNRCRGILSGLKDTTWAASPSYSHVTELLASLEVIGRFEPVREVLADAISLRPPSVQALSEATRSRRSIYRYASAAYMFWRNVQAGNPEALRKLFNETVLGPAPVWQRFEMAVGLAAAESLSRAIGVPFSLGTIAPSSLEPFAVVNELVLYWQSRTPHYVKPLPEPSEKIAMEVFESLGLSEGFDRPDFVLADEQQKRVLSIFEAKYYEHEEDEGAGALRDAVQQLVRYARGYRSNLEVKSLLENSVVALASTAHFVTNEPRRPTQPWVVDFKSLLQGALAHWARGVANEHHFLASLS